MKRALYNIVTDLEKGHQVKLSSDTSELVDDIIDMVVREKVTFKDFYIAIEEMVLHEKGTIEFTDIKTARRLVAVIHGSK